MASSVMFGLGVIALLIAWRRVFTPSLVDHYRDKLFDLRGDARDHFGRVGQLDSQEYRRLRDTINQHLLYLEEVSVFGIGALLAQVKEDPKASEAFAATAHSKLDMPEHVQFCSRARSTAAELVFEYAARASLTLHVIATCAVPFLVVWKIASGGIKAAAAAPKLEFARVAFLVLALVGLQGKFRPSVEAVIAKAAAENAKRSEVQAAASLA